MSKTVQPHASQRPALGGVITSLRDEHKRITRERIIAAAERLFVQNGFRATTIEQIAKAAGTTATTFYRHFKGKSDLASLLQGQLTGEVLGVMRKLEAVRSPSRKSVRGWVDQYFEMWQRVHILCEAYWEATSTDAALTADIVPASLDMTGMLTDLLQRWPENVRDKLQLRLTVLVLALDRVAYIANSCDAAAQRSAILDEFAEVLWTSLFEKHSDK